MKNMTKTVWLLLMLVVAPYSLYGKDKTFWFKNELTNEVPKEDPVTNRFRTGRVKVTVDERGGATCKGPHEKTLNPGDNEKITTKCCIKKVSLQIESVNPYVGYRVKKWSRSIEVWNKLYCKDGSTGIIKLKDGKVVFEWKK